MFTDPESTNLRLIEVEFSSGIQNRQILIISPKKPLTKQQKL